MQINLVGLVETNLICLKKSESSSKLKIRFGNYKINLFLYLIGLIKVESV